MTKIVIVSLVAVLFAVSATAADVSGVWSLRLTTSDGESAPRVSVTLKQDGDRVTGSCVIGDTDEKFTLTGQVIDNAVTWRCASKGPVEASFSGTIIHRAGNDWVMDDASASSGDLQRLEKSGRMT